jgi:hypothetical protein
MILLFWVPPMIKNPDKTYINTTIKTDLLRSLKVLAAQEGMRINQLLEEGIQDLLEKYEKKPDK